MSNKRFDKVYVEITNNCNLNCSFCLNTKRAKKYMTKNEFGIVIEKIKDYTDLILLHIKGEPLLSPCLKEILNLCDKYNIDVNITTNGVLLKDKLEILLNAKCVRQINISIHCYLENANLGQEYLLNIYNSAQLIKSKTNKYISYRIWKSDDKIGELLSFLEEKYNKKNIIHELENKGFAELAEKIFVNQDVEFEWPNINNEHINKQGKCYGLRNQLGILVNGDIVPCCLDGEGTIILGNIYKDTIEDVINSKRAAQMIQGFERRELVENLCKTCGFIKKFNVT